MGLTTHDGLMADASPDGREERLAFLKETRASLRPFEEGGDAGPSPLPFDEAIDCQALIQTLDDAIFEEEELPFSHSFPGASMEASSALYTVFSRDYEPLESRLSKLTARIEKIPRLLHESRALISSPVEVWTKTAIASSSTLPGFLETILAAGRENGACPALEKAVEKAKSAAADYRSWLEGDLLPRAGKNHAIGEEKFEHLLTLKHFGYNSAELIELGRHYLEETRARIGKVAQSIDPRLSYDELKEKIRSDYPGSFEETLAFCRDAMKKSRDYVVQSGFADVPDNEELVVIETPPMFRPTTPLAAYIPPGKFAPSQRGVYMVTRTDDPAAMKDFNRTALFNKSLHEGYPGHHLQFACSNLHPTRMRLSHTGSELVEGWAHYCEDYVATNGFPDYQSLHFTMNLELIWKACRIIIDVRLSSGEMTMDEAVEMLMKEASFTRGPATAEVQRYTYTPTYQLSYLLGKHLIMEMKKDLKTRYKEVFSEREFHNLLLYSGTIPLNLMKKVAERPFNEKIKKVAGGV
jgi:uncharacterized protein (DUF885 family)